MRQAKAPHTRPRGNSFGSCLFLVVLFFGGIGFYYFNFFQWRHLENPHEGLNYLTSADGPQLNSFRKAALADVVDPARVEVGKLNDIRKRTKKGTENYPEFKQDLTEILNRCRDLMSSAKLRTIPKAYDKHYKDALTGISEIYRSALSLKESVGADIDADKAKAFEESTKYLRQANGRLNSSREFFTDPNR